MATRKTGETYYYSPLSVNIFGFCNYETELLNEYVYGKGEGKKVDIIPLFVL